VHALRLAGEYSVDSVEVATAHAMALLASGGVVELAAAVPELARLFAASPAAAAACLQARARKP